ncbi:MAG: CYTH domain-containing protein [Desulfuromonadales bacterium]|nr:CYTH domain-containing protein [Desulfuromonadales bacterium]
MIEYEKRFKLTDKEYANILAGSISWSDPTTVTDITFGLSGATSMQTHGWVVRVRKKRGKVIVDYKAPIDKDWTQWEEIAMEVSDFSSAISFFMKIGLKPGLVLERERREALMGGVSLSIDDFKYLGKFIEIEVDGENDRTKTLFNNSISSLGLGNKTPQKPYGSLLLEKMNNSADIKNQIEQYVSELSTER